MKHVLRLPNFTTLLIAASLFTITLPLVNGCKTTSKTANSSTMKTTAGSFSDTSAVPKTDTGKTVNGGKDKPPRR